MWLWHSRSSRGAALAAALLPMAAPVRLERRAALMGTWLSIEVEAASREGARVASEMAILAGERVEARLSTWRGDSELSRLNATPAGERLSLGPELARDLERAVELWRATGGAFDPGVGALVDAWGLRTGGRQPSVCELAAALACGGMAALELDGGVAVRRHAGLRLEEGGFGKGVALDAALAALRGAGVGAATLDFGGQVARLGRPITLGIAHPKQRDRIVAELRLGAGSASTSGNGERGIVVEGRALGHLLDPRSGRPAEDFGSLTVVAGDAMTADALSTGLYVLGADAALAWAATRTDCAVIVVELAGEAASLRASASLGGRLRARPGVELSFHR